MKKFITLLVLVVFATFMFNSCSKFEEGPGFSLKSKKARLTNTWEIEKIIDQNTGDKISIMDLFAGGEDTEGDDYGFDIELDLKLAFEKDGNMEMIIGISFFGMSQETSSSGTWEFVGDTGLEMTVDMSDMEDYDDGESSNDTSEPETLEYNILRLASNQLWLEYTEEVTDSTGTYDVEYEIHLIPEE